MTEQANFSELRNKISNWDLEAEQMLINKLNIFTNSYKNDFSVFTKNMENLTNNLLNAEVEHYKAISNLKDISQNKFIEEKLEENADSVSEESDRGVETGSSKEIFLDNNAKMKKAVEISMKNMEEINLKKEKNKEQIEDDTVSVASKNLVLENTKKYGTLPFIIGTDDFMKDKRIGLTNKKDEDGKQDENDEPEIDKEILEDRKVTEKTKRRWDQVEQRRKTQKAKEEKAKIKNSAMNQNNNNNFNEEVKEQVEVPHDFEVIDSVKSDNNENINKNNNSNNNTNNNSANISNNINSNANINNKININNNIAISTGKGPGIPPPPPPPPMPVFNPANVKPKNKIEKKEVNNNNINTNVANINQSVNINNNIPNNNINNNINNINMFKPKINQSVNSLLLQGLNNLKDDDEDDDDFDSGIWSKKNRKIPILNNNIISQSQNPIISPQTNIIPNNNNLKVNKTKLNNIFEDIENDDNEEEQKEEEKKNNIIEPIKNNVNVLPNENSEELKNENEQNKNIFENPEKNNYPVKPNVKLNNLFNNLEEEKNNTENIELKKGPTNVDMKTLLFGDDDE